MLTLTVEISSVAKHIEKNQGRYVTSKKFIRGDILPRI